MLLDIELTIKVTNNGKDSNNTGVTINQNKTISDAFVTLEFARKNVFSRLQNYIYKKYGTVTDKEFDEIYKNLTFGEMYDQNFNK